MSTVTPPENTTTSRAYLSALERVESAMADVQQALADFAPMCAHLRAEVAAGRDVDDLIVDVKQDGLDARRRRMHAAMRRFESEVQTVRGLGVFVLVERGGMTITDAARLSGISPQMARRLYRNATPGEPALD